jgi:hypothetical protein
MKILLLDIETAPNTAYVWGLFKENIPLARLVETGYVLCWSAKWYGETGISYMDMHRSSRIDMLKGIHSLLEQADAVIHYNGTSFDIPTLNKEFIKHNLTPPSPYKQIDLLRTARSQFKFTSNKLDHVAQELGVGKKKEHRGFELWIDCMKNNNSDAWAEMEEYNIGDVILLERVYDRLKPWIKNHPNQNLYSNGRHVCPACGGEKLHKRGTSYTISGRYQRYVCLDCHKWSRDVKKDKESLAISGAA